jgi:hypothetical protein
MKSKRQLAIELGRSERYVAALRAAGLPPTTDTPERILGYIQATHFVVRYQRSRRIAQAPGRPKPVGCPPCQI